MLRLTTAGKPLSVAHRLPIYRAACGFFSTKAGPVKSAGNPTAKSPMKSGGNPPAQEPVPDLNQLNASLPTMRTTVILRKIPSGVTQTSLREALKGIETCRKVELEPGCVLHFSNEVAAERTMDTVSQNFNCDASLSKTLLPSLLLRNLPSDISSEAILKAFAGLNPTGVTSTGLSYQVGAIKTASEALKAAQVLEQIEYEGQKLRTSVVKIGSHYCVSVFNFPATVAASDEVKNALRTALGSGFESVPIVPHSSAQHSIRVRFSDSPSAEAAKKILAELTINGEQIVLSNKLELKRPVIFIRKIVDRQEQVESVMKSHGAERVVFNYSRDGVLADLAVAHFASAEKAHNALKYVKGLSIDGKTINVSYKEVEDPGVVVSNLPEGIDEDAVKTAFSPLSIDSINLKGTKAVITFTHTHDMELALSAFNRRLVRGNEISVNKKPILDYGFDISLPSGRPLSAADAATIQDALAADSKAVVKAITVNTNTNAFVSFMTLQDTIKARDAFVKDAVTLDIGEGHGVVTSQLSSQPGFAVEIAGFSPDSPAKEIEDLIESAGDKRYLLLADRSATVKFRRHLQVVPGMKLLKQIRIDGAGFQVERYYPQPEKGGDTEYDIDSLHEEFDRGSLRRLIADHMDSDPATRYQIAKNEFERALIDARANNDLNYLVTSTLTPETRKEAEALVQEDMEFLTEEQKQRLFDLFLRNDDMKAFASDFKDMMAFFGDIEEGNPFNWAQFEIANEDDWNRYAHFRDAMTRRDLDLAKAKHFADARGQTIRDYLDDIADEDTARLNNNDHTFQTKFMKTIPRKNRKKAAAEAAEEEKKTEAEELEQRWYRAKAIEKLRKSTVIDHDSTESIEAKAAKLDLEFEDWSGVILDNDAVQHTLPLHREMSFRCLMMIGNMRGVGGFGFGKGKDAAEAADKAFMAAKKNLHFIDLYDNSAFAHDLYGRWNGCHCYIRATPRSRRMVAAPWVDEVLGRMGVASASVKIIGNRDPYASIRALFNALSKHQNIDETAKERGLRYLSLKWAYKNGIGL